MSAAKPTLFTSPTASTDDRGSLRRRTLRWISTGRTAATTPPWRSTAFLELWTAKEAVLKATGRGIAFGLHRLQVTREPPRLTWLDGDDANAWQLQRLQMGDAYVAALAWRGGARRVNVRELAASA